MKIEIEKHVRALVDQVVELVEGEIARLVDQTKTRLVDAFRQGGETVAAPGIAPGARARAAKVTRTRARSRSRRADSTPAPDTKPAAAPTKKPRKCGSCGEVGHRADRCPNVTQSVPVIDRDGKPDNGVQPPPVSKNDRFARIEAAARARRGN